MPQAAPEFVAPLLNFGAMGCMLWWFMIRNEIRQKAQEDATDRLTRTIVLQQLTLDLPPRVEAHYQQILKEVEVAEIQRKPRK